jgi:RNA polymerase sigma factor (sigma-70 family)
LTEPDELAAFWRGDDRAIETVYRAHLSALLVTARFIVGSAEAESVVQEVFVELIRNEELRRRFTGGSLSGWLTAITRFKSLEHRKRSGRPPLSDEAQPTGATASPEPRLEARDLLERFMTAGILSEPEADFFRRRFVECGTQVQVAVDLKVPRSTLEGWERRVCERFRRFALEGA